MARAGKAGKVADHRLTDLHSLEADNICMHKLFESPTST